MPKWFWFVIGVWVGILISGDHSTGCVTVNPCVPRDN